MSCPAHQKCPTQDPGPSLHGIKPRFEGRLSTSLCSSLRKTMAFNFMLIQPCPCACSETTVKQLRACAWVVATAEQLPCHTGRLPRMSPGSRQVTAGSEGLTTFLKSRHKAFRECFADSGVYTDIPWNHVAAGLLHDGDTEAPRPDTKAMNKEQPGLILLIAGFFDQCLLPTELRLT